MKTTPQILWLGLITLSIASCGRDDAAPQEPTDEATQIATQSTSHAAAGTTPAVSDDQTTDEVHLAEEMTDPDADQPAIAEDETPEADDSGADARTFSDDTADEVSFASKPSTSLVGSAEEEEFRQRVNRHNERVRARPLEDPAPATAESPTN